MSSKKYWYVYRTQRSHYEAHGLPFASTYEEWEPVYLERRSQGIVVLPMHDWRLVAWPLDDDERHYNALMGGVTFSAPEMGEAAA